MVVQLLLDQAAALLGLCPVHQSIPHLVEPATVAAERTLITLTTGRLVVLDWSMVQQWCPNPADEF